LNGGCVTIEKIEEISIERIILSLSTFNALNA
jgi:hypothetical protein